MSHVIGTKFKIAAEASKVDLYGPQQWDLFGELYQDPTANRDYHGATENLRPQPLSACPIEPGAGIMHRGFESSFFCAKFGEDKRHPPYNRVPGMNFMAAGTLRLKRFFKPRRSIIVHFHFFKNAGTSVESILQKQFGKGFMTYEAGKANETFPAATLIPVLEQHRKIRAISSHTICFPPPSHADWSFFPIVFFRHPLDRILSMYRFEKKQASQTRGTRLAKTHGLADYISARLEPFDERTLRNYQAWMLARSLPGMDVDAAILEAAVNTLDELPVVGVVDEFDESIRQFSRWLAPHFRGLKMTPEHRNRSALAGMGMVERLDVMKNAIGEDLYQCLERENALDLELYRLARERLRAPG